jgi:uncharacterized protein (TIGR02270 family)
VQAVDVKLVRPLKPVGFHPSEISGLVNRRVVEVHADEAGFLWMQRHKAVHAPHFRLKHLARLDSRVEGHLEGLRVAGDVGWAAAQGMLDNADPGTVFVIGYLAFGCGDADRMRFALHLGLSQPGFREALVAALAWLDIRPVRSALERLGQSAQPVHRCIALSVLAAHRVDPGSMLRAACESDDPALRARALRSIGELKRRDLLGAVQRGERDSDGACRFWAGCTMALLGDAAGARVAFDAAQQLPGLERPAIEVAMRCGETSWARGLVRSLAGEPATLRQAIQAAGALGDPASVPWLLSHMGDTRQACVAGEAFSMITGADLDHLGLQQDAPEEEVEGADPQDADLPWPNVEAVSNWWAGERGRFTPGARYLAGRPVSAAAAVEVLREGYQRQRAGAATELARLSETALVFPVSGRADRQLLSLAG